jgi:hypothetical protein
MISRRGKYHRSDMSKQDGAVMIGFNRGAISRALLCLQGRRSGHGVAGIELWEPRREDYHCELVFGSRHNGTSANSPHIGLVLMVGFLSSYWMFSK